MITINRASLLRLVTLFGVLSLSSLTNAGPVIDGNEWYQPEDLHANYSWNDFNAACPGGTCSGQIGTSGPNISGWTWASADDVNALFNIFIQASDFISPMGPGPSQYTNPNSTFSTDALKVFHRTWEVYSGIAGVYAYGARGWIRDTSFSDPSKGLAAEMFHSDHDCCGPVHRAQTDIEYDKTFRFLDGGAWLYRPASQAVPAPPAAILMLLGLAILALNRRT